MHKTLTTFEKGMAKAYKVLLYVAMFFIGLSIGHALIKLLEVYFG